MELNKIMNEKLRTTIDFATFHMLDFSVTNNGKAIVVLVPRNFNAVDKHFKMDIGDCPHYFGSFGQLLEYALHFELFSEKYARELTEKYNKFTKNKGDK